MSASSRPLRLLVIEHQLGLRQVVRRWVEGLDSVICECISASEAFGNVATVSRSLIVACATPPELSGVALQVNGSLQFSFTNVAGASFTVLGTTNPALPMSEWEVIGPVIEVSLGQFIFTDPGPIRAQQFYRVRSP